MLVVLMCGNFLLVFALCLTLKHIFEINDITKKRLIWFTILTCMIVSIIMMLQIGSIINNLSKFLVIIVVTILLEILVLRIKLIPSIISVTIVETLLMVMEFLLKNVVANTDVDGVSIMNEIQIKLWLYLGFFLLLVFMLVFYTKSNNLMKRFISKSKENYLKLGYSIMTVSIAITNIEYYRSVKHLRVSKVFIVNLVAVIVYCIFSLVIVNIINRYEKDKEELKYQIFYNETLKYLMNDLRRFRHDYNNMLAVMGGYLQLKKYDDLEMYYKNIAQSIQCSNITNNKSVLDIKNAGLLGLIYYKLELAQKNNVIFKINVQTVVNEIDVKINEFCEILGILLDNAIECATNTTSKFVVLEVTEVDDCKVFKIKNSIKEIVDIKEIFKKGYSTKEGDGRGLGLYVVDKIVKETKNLGIYTQCNQSEFIQILYLYKMSKNK